MVTSGATLGSVSSLKVLVDGVPLPEAEARALWQRFSEHMEAHRGDLEGFAKVEGFASVQPAMGAEGAELHASRTARQQPYRTAPRGSAGSGPGGTVSGSRSGPGSATHHPSPRDTGKSPGNRRR
jgi:hypothetical protein